MGNVAIRPLRNRVIIQLENTENGKLCEYKSKGGIVIGAASMVDGSNMLDGLKERWALVIAVGPDVSDFVAGDRVLVENGKWTEAALVDGDYFWMTENEHVMLVDELYNSSKGKTKAVAEIQN